MHSIYLLNNFYRKHQHSRIENVNICSPTKCLKLLHWLSTDKYGDKNLCRVQLQLTQAQMKTAHIYRHWIWRA